VNCTATTETADSVQAKFDAGLESGLKALDRGAWGTRTRRDLEAERLRCMADDPWGVGYWSGVLRAWDARALRGGRLLAGPGQGWPGRYLLSRIA